MTTLSIKSTYLKQLILDNIPDVHFNKPLQKSKPEQVLSTKTKETAVAMVMDCSQIKEEIQVLMKAAQILQKKISASPKWKFQGSSDSYTPPVMLYMFCRQLIQGRKTIQTERKDAAI
ncbi:unnamed protein product [Ceutorhynchus assimilis]|uniref:Uncharacterized protein n=1 Tax=Ceutorhynchus assimilis TaxID=467358 RepID=A0A9N9MHH1_9CUCU|nr:unnamed protein product [Ceutorhynchus assimilis]